jgi:hypothetical protein
MKSKEGHNNNDSFNYENRGNSKAKAAKRGNDSFIDDEPDFPKDASRKIPAKKDSNLDFIPERGNF